MADKPETVFRRRTLPVLVAIFVAVLSRFCVGIHHLDAVYIEECSPGKYYWKEDEPTEFYACVESTRGVNPTVPDYVTNAIRMKCTEGTYMCSLENDPMFQPCSCKSVQREPDRPARLTPPASRPDEVASPATEPIRAAAAKQGPARPPGRERTKPSGSGAAVYDLIGASTLPPPDEAGNNKTGKARGLQQFAKQLSAVSTRTFPSLPANGCPDLYRRYANAHMFQGVLKPFTTLIECQRACLEERNCLGVDWNKLDSTPGSGADSRRCHFIYPESTRYGVQPSTDFCCDHFRRTYCLSTVVPVPGGATTPSSVGAGGLEALLAGVGGGVGGVGRTPVPGVGGFGTVDQFQVLTANLTIDRPSAVQSFGQYSAQSTGIFGSDGYANSNFPDAVSAQGSLGEIPDTGCPYTFQKFVGQSHPFGKNITSGTINNSAEKCKQWCLVRSFCLGVDFSFAARTCYFLREINSGLLVPSASVTHYQKTDCAPPLRCWSTRMTSISNSADTRVTDVNTPSVECQGVCFVRQTVGSTNVIERGCDTTRTGLSNLGCFVDGTPNSNFRTISCYCDTNRCNGLSVEALVSQMLYLPLDGDTLDHSGIGRHGMIPTGHSSPSFTCLDKANNCSALFMSGQCVSVPGLSQVSYTSAEIQGGQVTQVPRASFVVHYKRVPNGAANKQGVFGNSALSATRPTWAIFADNLTDTSTAGVITDGTQLLTVEDFKYSTAVDNRWHQHVLTYNGRNSPLATLQYYVDGVEMVGNSRLESGMISVRDQPVALGCVQGLNFVGFIDEARVFSTNLDKLDIDALLLMRDSNFW